MARTICTMTLQSKTSPKQKFPSVLAGFRDSVPTLKKYITQQGIQVVVVGVLQINPKSHIKFSKRKILAGLKHFFKQLLVVCRKTGRAASTEHRCTIQTSAHAPAKLPHADSRRPRHTTLHGMLDSLLHYTRTQYTVSSSASTQCVGERADLGLQCTDTIRKTKFILEQLK